MPGQSNAKRKVERKRERNTEKLAGRLLARHLHIAVPDSIVRSRLAGVGRVADYPTKLMERDMHCIAVVGAGASEPLLKRGGKLAKELEAKFGRNEAELERLKLVNNLDPKDLETRLIALSSSPAAALQVRDTISHTYNIKHPTLLGYELLAHLLKHRFLDAIVSFNFDELLDQSLDDELDFGEYKRVVSERDCVGIQASPSGEDYIPLYIKLHGTASEPDSLRFTPDSYYSIPQRVADVVEELLHTEHCVIVNVGFGLASFDFQRLLDIPQKLEIFNLSRKAINKQVVQKIDTERTAYKRKGKRKDKAETSGCWLHECNEGGYNCDDLILQLINQLKRKARQPGLKNPKRPSEGGLVQFRSVLRHEAIAKLLGPDTVHTKWALKPGWPKQEEIEYARRRTILELAFAGAKARGLLSLPSLVLDRPGRYYDYYRQITNGNGEDWTSLCKAAGLIESDDSPDRLLSDPKLRKACTTGKPITKERETWVLHKFDAKKLASRVLEHVRNPSKARHHEILTEAIRGLQCEADIEFHMRDDRVCSKAFKSPMTLPTATSLDVYRWLMFEDAKPEDRIYISSEMGEWLLLKTTRNILRDQEEIYLLLAFDINRKKLRDVYGKRLKIAVIEPWRHNRHMTILCDHKRPESAIYFARRLRAPVITAVYLDDIGDARRVTQMFKRRWDEAKKEEKVAKKNKKKR